MTKTSPSSHIVSGVLGGLVAVVIGAILIATGVIDTGNTTKVVHETGSAGPVATSGDGASGGTVHAIYSKVGPGVAFIEAKVRNAGTSLFGGSQQGTATGSGFALDKSGDILTNAHVVEGATSKDVTVRFGKQDPVDAKVVGRDPSTDLAVLRIDPSKTKITPLSLGNSDKVRVGDQAIAEAMSAGSLICFPATSTIRSPPATRPPLVCVFPARSPALSAGLPPVTSCTRAPWSTGRFRSPAVCLVTGAVVTPM